MTTIDTAQATLASLQQKRRAALARQADIAAERRNIAFAAHTGDADARARLDELAREDITMAAEVSSLDAAITEAQSRVADARRAADLEARHERGREARKRAAKFHRQGLELDKAAQGFLRRFNDLRDEAIELRKLGLDHLRLEAIDVACKRALQSMLMGTPLKLEHVAPSERANFAHLVAGWTRMIEAWAAQQLGEHDKAA